MKLNTNFFLLSRLDGTVNRIDYEHVFPSILSLYYRLLVVDDASREIIDL
jgi:hypothetical protein